MSYYPILNAPGCSGWTTLCNYPPNNWELRYTEEQYVNVTWQHDNEWRSAVLGKLKSGKMRTVTRKEVDGLVPDGKTPFLSLSAVALPARSESLPTVSLVQTNIPRWRATLGLSSNKGSTSYQGEIDPFPIPGSMLSFSPFIQYGEGIENYLIFLNLESGAQDRVAQVEVFDAAEPNECRGTFPVQNNNATAIRLDGLGLDSEDLPMVICKGMSAIPLFFSSCNEGAFMSLEHTHPPASMFIHGGRWKLQKILKSSWFNKTGAQK